MKKVIKYRMGTTGWILTLECGHERFVKSLPPGELKATCWECGK